MNSSGIHRFWPTKRLQAAGAFLCFCLLGLASSVYGQADHVNQLIRQLEAGRGFSADSRSALIKIGAPAVEPLIAVLNDRHASVRKEAALILGRIKDSRAVAPLIGALKDEDYGVSQSAAEALASIGAPAVEPLIATFKDAGGARAARVLGKIGAPAVDPLIVALKDLNATVREDAALALGFTKDGRAFDPLITALGDRETAVNMSAADALGQIGASAVAPLIAALHYKNPSFHINLNGYFESEALARIGAPAVGPLITALQDADSEVREESARALGEIRDARAVEPLFVTLKDKEDLVRQEAAESLGEIKDPRAAEPLIAALKDPNSKIQLQAAKALVEIKDPREAEPLIDLLHDPDHMVRNYAGMALAVVKDPRATSALLGALREGDTDVIAGARKFFLRRGEPGSEEALIEALTKSGDMFMAQDLLNSGNAKLESAAAAWAATHGYQITHMYGVGSAKWGSAQ